MKTRNYLFCLLFIVAFGMNSFAQERSYKDGSVWSMSFIKVNYGHDEDYLNSLKNTWKAIQDEGVRQGLILSSKILAGESTNPEDYNLILMIEYKNLAGMEGNEDKWDAIESKIVGSADALGKLRESRVSMRSMYGQRLMREVIYK